MKWVRIAYRTVYFKFHKSYFMVRSWSYALALAKAEEATR
jgi:hypothetical protein